MGKMFIDKSRMLNFDSAVNDFIFGEHSLPIFFLTIYVWLTYWSQQFL